MKILFLNCWNGKLLPKIKDYLRPHITSTDIFCFQEIPEKPRGEVEKLPADFSVHHFRKYLNDKDDFYQVTFVNKKYHVEKTEVIFPNEDGIGVGLLTEINTSGKKLTLVNFHGFARPGDKLDTPERIHQSEGLAKYLENFPGTKIIGGDFNLEFETESVKILERAGWRNLIREYNITNTRNRLVWDRYPESKQFSSDFCFTSGKITVMSFSVPEVEISDHLPMLLEFDF